MCVGIYTPRKDVSAAGVNNPGPSWDYKIPPQLLDDSIFDVHVLLEDPVVVHDRPALDQETSLGALVKNKTNCTSRGTYSI